MALPLGGCGYQPAHGGAAVVSKRLVSEHRSQVAVFDAALLRGDMKYIQGRQSGTGFWTGPAYPNTTVRPPSDEQGCPTGCLFNISADPGEHNDLSAALPQTKLALRARLYSIGAGTLQSDLNAGYDYSGAEAAMVDGFWQPWL